MILVLCLIWSVGFSNTPNFGAGLIASLLYHSKKVSFVTWILLWEYWHLWCIVNAKRIYLGHELQTFYEITYKSFHYLIPVAINCDGRLKLDPRKDLDSLRCILQPLNFKCFIPESSVLGFGSLAVHVERCFSTESRTARVLIRATHILSGKCNHWLF